MDHVVTENVNSHYITGICEASANFTYTKSGSNIAPRFSIKFSPADNKLALFVLNYFKCGNIYSIGIKTTKKPKWGFIASKNSDLDKIIEHFEKYPLKGVKKDCYNVWKEIVSAKKPYRKSNQNDILSLAENLSSLTPRRPRREKDNHE